MFLGYYEHKIDARSRVAIPAKFREELREGLILSFGLDRCINVYPPKTWQEMAASPEFAAPLITKESARRMRRFTFSSAFTQELDGLGRILLPAPLRQYAGIKDVVVIAGVNTYLEIWSKENWDAEKERMDEEARGIAERMERRE